LSGKKAEAEVLKLGPVNQNITAVAQLVEIEERPKRIEPSPQGEILKTRFSPERINEKKKIAESKKYKGEPRRDSPSLG